LVSDLSSDVCSSDLMPEVFCLLILLTLTMRIGFGRQ